ncbi:MAG: DNA primase [Clostridiales bacterium]|nr:DNA primase [Clostridiales bacterium]
MYYPPEIVEDVRANADIVEVISAYVKLNRVGGDYVGLCPFHNEKTPSFRVSPNKQMFYCFGCGAGGNVFGFIMKYENLSFTDALETIAERTHYSLPKPGDDSGASRLKETIYEMNKFAARFFYNAANETEGRAANEYLDARGVSSAIRKRFGLGYAPKSQSVYAALKNGGFDENDILSSGLVVAGKNGKPPRDRFFGRLMFPIFDARGRVSGFGGRVLSDGEPKYLNSPETPVFNKSRNLYGINFAKKSRSILLVEGYMDVISLHQAGFTNAVAALGTAFNDNHTIVIKRYSDDVVLLFDADDAGVKASLRAIPILTRAKLRVKALTLPNAKDPDEFIKKFGAEAFKQRLRDAVSHVTFQISKLREGLDFDKTEDKALFAVKAAGIIAKLESPVERDAYADETANISGVSAAAIKAEIEKSAGGEPAGDPLFGAAIVNRRGRGFSRGKDKAKIALICLLASRPRLCGETRGVLEPLEMLDDVYETMLNDIYARAGSGDEIHPAEIISHFDTVESQEKASAVFADPFVCDNIEKTLNDLIRGVKKQYADDKLSALQEHDETALQTLIDYKRNAEKLYITISDG